MDAASLAWARGFRARRVSFESRSENCRPAAGGGKTAFGCVPALSSIAADTLCRRALPSTILPCHPPIVLFQTGSDRCATDARGEWFGKANARPHWCARRYREILVRCGGCGTRGAVFSSESDEAGCAEFSPRIYDGVPNK